MVLQAPHRILEVIHLLQLLPASAAIPHPRSSSPRLSFLMMQCSVVGCFPGESLWAGDCTHRLVQPPFPFSVSILEYKQVYSTHSSELNTSFHSLRHPSQSVPSGWKANPNRRHKVSRLEDTSETVPILSSF